MFPFMKLLILAPFYLVFTHDTDWERKTMIPIYSSLKDCQDQANVVDAIMQNRSTLSIGKFVSQSNPHAFCIATGWTPQATGGQPFAMPITGEEGPVMGMGTK